MNGSSQLRASDADRERVAQELRAHYAAGRLTADELSDRLEAVYASRTGGDLASLGDDLPVARAPVGGDVGRARRRRGLYQDAGAVVITNVACVAIWAISGGEGGFWPEWVMLASGLRLARDGWRLLGPGAEADVAPTARAGRREERRDRRASHGRR